MLERQIILSIIIPVYNCEKYLHDCLDSCINQDIDKSEYEILCIDDCSTDNSLIILRDYEKNYDNVHVFSLSHNSGVGVARNTGLKLLHGNYCMFIDADDFLMDNCLKDCMNYLKNADYSTELCLGRYHFEEQGYSDRHLYYNSGTYVGCNPATGYITNRIIPFDLAVKLHFQENIFYGEDELFNFELNLLNPNIVTIDKAIYFYRINNDSACNMTPERRIKRMDSLINAAVYIKETYDLNQKRVLGFYNHRIKMALDLTCYLKHKDRIHYLKVLRDLDLLSYQMNSTHTFSLFALYIKHYVRVNKKRVTRKIKSIAKKALNNKE